VKLYVWHWASALAVLGVVASSGSAASRPCEPEGSTTLASSHESRVYRIERERGGRSTAYTYACLRSSGSQVLLASDAEPSAIFPVPAISLIGPYVGYAVDTDSDPTEPGGRMTYVEVDDLRPPEQGREQAGLVVSAGHRDVARVGSMKVSSHGAVAWIACPAPPDGPLASDPNGACTKPGTYARVFKARLEPDGTAHVNELDRGRTIDPHSLRRVHLGVAWRHNGKRRAAKLR
jgi:hypothetical protein